MAAKMPKPQPGKVVLLSVGMSNATQAFSTFKRLADADEDRDPALVLVDGAQGGMTAARIKDADDKASGTKYWGVVDDRLKAAGATREQVQVAWIKQADAGPNQGFPKYAETLRDELRQIVQLLHTRFPNLKMVSVESGIGWVPFILQAADYQGLENAPEQMAKMSRKPSEYFADNWYATFWFEAENDGLQALIDQVGEDNCLFETDFPHPTCLYPTPLEAVESQMSALRLAD